MRRREFIAGIGGAAAWPLAARAQQGERARRIGLLMPFVENDPDAKLLPPTFTQALADLGWADGRNVRMDLRWAGADTNRIRALAQELVGLRPDIILTGTAPATVAVPTAGGEAQAPSRFSGCYFLSNSLSVAVIRPISGWARQ